MNILNCRYFKKCGACRYIGTDYDEHLRNKLEATRKILAPYATPSKIIGMRDPYFYRCKVTATFTLDKNGDITTGRFMENTRKTICVDTCLIENKKADDIILKIRDLARSFKFTPYDWHTGKGILRHIVVRIGYNTGEIMVTLVTGTPFFPSRNNFIKELKKKCPEINTVVQNINGADTSLILGERSFVLYGKGYISDKICGKTFRVSSGSFYQVNPVQTEILYKTAIKYAGLTKQDAILDAYCGTGTIGICASDHCLRAVGCELNGDAVRDAYKNREVNKARNVDFVCADATLYINNLARKHQKIDVLFMDPPRNGSTESFIKSVSSLSPRMVVYISCSPKSLSRDLECFNKNGYGSVESVLVDMFPFTDSVETVVLLSKGVIDSQKVKVDF